MINRLNILKNTGNKKTFLYEKVKVNLTHYGEKDHISKQISRNNFYEKKMLEYISSLNIKGNYVDIGANIGNHSVYFGLFCESNLVYSFEPQKNNYELLLANIVNNNLSDKTIVNNFGLGVKDEMAYAVVNPKNYGSTYLKNDENGDITIKNAEEYFESIKIDVLKIDAENMSIDIFRCLKEKILADKPLLIIEASKEELKEIENTLKIKHLRVFNATPTYIFKF